MPEDHFCGGFKLDFDTLTEQQQKQIQRRLMEQGDCNKWALQLEDDTQEAHRMTWDI